MKVLVVGCGQMGEAHALAFSQMPEYKIVGLVNRSLEPREALSKKLNGVPHFSDYSTALEALSPDVVAICTHTEFHAKYAKMAFEKKAHVFVEKPLAESIESALDVIEAANRSKKKLLVGYILRHSPSWQLFIEKAKLLGKPLVIRLNLNQQSHGKAWDIHKKILKLQSPIVDCGIHYVDVMCQITESTPKKVDAIGARLSDEIPSNSYNYGQLQIVFEDGSVGWYEAGWGPMMSENAYFIKDVIGPKGSISMTPSFTENSSSSIENHTKGQILKVHYSDQEDEVINLKDEPTHEELCKLEQEYLLKAIKDDLDLSSHHKDVIQSMEIVLQADKKIKNLALQGANI